MLKLSTRCHTRVLQRRRGAVCIPPVKARRRGASLAKDTFRRGSPAKSCPSWRCRRHGRGRSMRQRGEVRRVLQTSRRRAGVDVPRRRVRRLRLGAVRRLFHVHSALRPRRRGHPQNLLWPLFGRGPGARAKLRLLQRRLLRAAFWRGTAARLCCARLRALAICPNSRSHAQQCKECVSAGMLVPCPRCASWVCATCIAFRKGRCPSCEDRVWGRTAMLQITARWETHKQVRRSNAFLPPGGHFAKALGRAGACAERSRSQGGS